MHWVNIMRVVLQVRLNKSKELRFIGAGCLHAAATWLVRWWNLMRVVLQVRLKKSRVLWLIGAGCLHSAATWSMTWWISCSRASRLASDAEEVQSGVIKWSRLFACCCNMVDEVVESHVCRLASEAQEV